MNKHTNNLEKLNQFLESYKNRILDEYNPIVKAININIDKYDINKDGQNIHHYKHVFYDKYNNIFDNVDLDDHIIINCDIQEEDPLEFSLSSANIFNIEKNKNLFQISRSSDEEMNDYPKWYLVKSNWYFLILNIKIIINRLKKPEEFSKVDKYILGILPISDDNKNDINLDLYKRISSKLNKQQKSALLNMIESKHLSLIKGPPGTGKTTVIEYFLNYSLQNDPKRRIIVATNLHSSMDSIINKINKNPFLKTKKILRLTKRAWSQRTPKQKELNITKCADIYITTLASQRMNVILSEKKFWFNGLKPILIIDEASASNILSILSHTSNIQKIIVIGDDQQLSPIYNSYDYNYFIQEGFQNEFRFFLIISFFNFLYEINRNNSCFLNINYRSQKDIIEFINNFYNGKLLVDNDNDDISFQISRSPNYIESKKTLRYIINQKNLTIKNTIFMCEYKKVIKDLNIFLDKKIFSTTRSIQGNEANNICIFLCRNIDSNNYSAQLDFRSINVAISRAKNNVYIFSYDNIIDMHLIDKANNWRKIRVKGRYVSISSLIKRFN